jgi:hypothetical protein
LFWAGLHPDVRTLIVTVAGTLIGGILVVAVVAIGVMFARMFHTHGMAKGIEADSSPALVLGLLGFTGRWMSKSALERLAVLFCCLGAGTYALILLLALLGVAAGIR